MRVLQSERASESRRTITADDSGYVEETKPTLSFGQLHAVSAAFYLVKVGCVLALAVLAARGNRAGPLRPSTS